jgi:hypothetical protein
MSAETKLKVFQLYTDRVRARLAVLSCLALTTPAYAQRITDAPAQSASPPEGALVVSADPAACLVPSTLHLARIEKGTYGIASRETGACRWIIEGLPPGTYEVGLTHARGSGGRIRFNHVAGPPAELVIPAPKVMLTGVVRINGQPVAGATLMFMARPIQSGLPTVTTNADGVYTATLPDDGLYSMRLGGRDVFGQGTRATFAEGAHRYDWDVTGGTLVIRDARAPQRTRDFMINVWHDGGFQGGSAPSFGATREMRGAPFGTHTVSIRRGSAPEETIGTVSLTADAPRAEVVIDVP